MQMEAVECGAASLSIILSHYGLYMPLEKLRIECGVSRDGSKATNILKAARRFGLEASGGQFKVHRLHVVKLPFIVFWEFNHFLVVEGFGKNKVYLNDPAYGHREVTLEEFAGSFTGLVLKMDKGPDFKKGGSPPGALKTVFKKLINHKKSVFFALLTSLGLIVPSLAIPVFTQVFLDDLLSLRHADWILELLIIMGIVAILQGALTYLRAWSLTRWQARMTISESSRFFWHILRLPIEFFSQRYGGEVAGRAAYNETVATVITGQAATAVLDLLTIVFYLILLFQYNVTLTIIGCFFTFINVVVLLMMFRMLVEKQMKIQQDYSKAYGVAVSGIQSIESLKAGGNEGDFFTKWAGYQSKFLETTQEVELSNQRLSLTPTFLNALNSAIIMAVGGFDIMSGLMSIGMFSAFQNLMSGFNQPVVKLINLGQSLQTTQMQILRLDDVLNYPVAPEFTPDIIDNADYIPPTGKLTGLVEFKDVTFGYSRLEAPLIENFNLTLRPGERVALVGASGSGKSTVNKLLAGLYRPWSGEILFDGVPLDKIPRHVFSASIASVDQEIVLFNATVTENISLFNSTIKFSDIMAAAKDAVIHDDIAALKGGYEAILDENGRNFSGGQRQRLEIARALAGNPNILVLDEATSALDTVTEKNVTDNIRKRRCSSLIVAHRLSTIRDCDEIIVMHMGKIIQRGTHEEMIKVDGLYKKLTMIG